MQRTVAPLEPCSAPPASDPCVASRRGSEASALSEAPVQTLGSQTGGGGGGGGVSALDRATLSLGLSPGSPQMLRQTPGAWGLTALRYLATLADHLGSRRVAQIAQGRVKKPRVGVKRRTGTKAKAKAKMVSARNLIAERPCSLL